MNKPVCILIILILIYLFYKRNSITESFYIKQIYNPSYLERNPLVCYVSEPEEYLDKSYNYSISHKIRKEHDKYNFVNFGFPGAGNYSSTEFFLDSLNKNFPFPKINKPEKIIYLFYEGNDLENNIRLLAEKILLFFKSK